MRPPQSDPAPRPGAVPDGAADVIIGAFLLHLVRSKRWLAEITRLLAPGGAAAFNIFMGEAPRFEGLEPVVDDGSRLVVVQSPSTSSTDG